MKTKHILTAMVLPAMLAACTADEIVENNNVNLDGVAKLNPITITMGENADSRLLWDESGLGNWKWGAEGDQFSAFLVSAPSVGVMDALLTNYVYSSEDGVHYTTTSVMTEGTYWFYAPGTQDKKDNDLISFKIPVTQTADYYTSDAAQLFFTPLYRLAKEDAPENVDLELTNWYGRAVMPITNGSDEAFTVKQILLTLENGKKWTVEGKISPVEMSKSGLEYAFVDGVKTPINNIIDDDATNNETLAELKARLQKAYDIVINPKSEELLALDLEEGVEIAAGASHTFTMLVPATEAKVKCNIKLITDKGLVEITTASQSNYTKSGVQFKHNGIMPMFGLKNANKQTFKYYTVNEKDLKPFGADYYVTTYDYMMQLINTVNGDISVFNIGEWSIDSEMAKAIKESDAKITFTQPITVEDAESAVSLTKVVFDEVTVAGEKTVTFGSNTKADIINVEEEAVVKLNSVKKVTNVVNNGTLTINKNAGVAKVKTYGILNLDQNDAEVEIIAGTLNYNNSAEDAFSYNASNLTIARADTKNVEINIAENVVFNADAKIEATKNKKNNVTYSTTINNSGTINFNTSASDLIMSGKFVNEGSVIGTASALKINGAAENEGTISAKVYIGENATLKNYFLLNNTNNDNNGKITTYEGSTTNVATGAGVIDNTEKAVVNANEAQTVQYVFEEACDSEDLMDLDTQKFAINKLVFKAKLTLNEKWVEQKKTLYGVDVLEFATGSSLYVNLPTTDNLPVNVDKIIISANVTFSGFKNYANINLEKACELHVCKNMTLTITDVNITAADTVELTTDELGNNDVKGKVVGGKVADIDANTQATIKK